MPTEAYRPRRPAATLLHRTVREHLETYLARAGCDDDWRSRVLPHVQQAFHAYLRRTSHGRDGGSPGRPGATPRGLPPVGAVNAEVIFPTLGKVKFPTL
jgi:hypothetical protein